MGYPHAKYDINTSFPSEGIMFTRFLPCEPTRTSNDLWPPLKQEGSYSKHTHLPNMRSLTNTILRYRVHEQFSRYIPFDLWWPRMPLDLHQNQYASQPWSTDLQFMRFIAASIPELLCLHSFHGLTSSDLKGPLTSTTNNRKYPLNMTELFTC